VPRSRAAPPNDPAGDVQRVGTMNHADQTHSVNAPVNNKHTNVLKNILINLTGPNKYKGIMYGFLKILDMKNSTNFQLALAR